MKRLVLISVVLTLLLMACDSDAEEDSDNTVAEPTTNAVVRTEQCEAGLFNDPEDPFMAFDFTLTSIDEQEYTLSELQGEWVLLNFWATWCEPCVAEMPALQTIYDTEDVILLGINVREDTNQVRTFLQENNITYPILMTPLGDEENQVLSNYSTSIMPQTLIVAPNGEIRWRAFAELELETFRDTLACVRDDYNTSS